jgi:hypothetical protein
VQGIDHPVARALGRSVWQLLDDHRTGGVAREALVLRARTGPGGVRLLEWQDGTAAALADAAAVPAAPGVYGPLCWRWPEVPPGGGRGAARRARSPACCRRWCPWASRGATTGRSCGCRWRCRRARAAWAPPCSAWWRTRPPRATSRRTTSGWTWASSAR